MVEQGSLLRAAVLSAQHPGEEVTTANRFVLCVAVDMADGNCIRTPYPHN